MSASRSSGARICSRCGTRADARRGNSAICLSCGQPFPVGAVGSYGAPPPAASSSALPWVVGLLSVFFVLSMGAAFFVLSRSSKSTPPPSTPTLPAEVETGAPAAASVVPSASAAPSASAKPVAAALTDAERDELSGSYTCSMDDSPAFPCRIAGGNLEKLAGSQRFKGPVSKVDGGNISFSGTFFCPFGDCTHPVATTFIRQGPGRYKGKFGVNTIRGGGPGGEVVLLTKVGR
ncbi:MAG: hypothetical protein ABIP89_19780 [Polyangiaceae bacterium]